VPWIFGDSGYGAYFPLLPIYIALRFFLAWFNAKHNVAAEEDDFMEEWRKLKRTCRQPHGALHHNTRVPMCAPTYRRHARACACTHGAAAGELLAVCGC